jgi:hypothetical protein
MKNHVREARSALSAVHRHWDGELLKMIRANAPSRDTGPQPGAAANSLRLVLVVSCKQSKTGSSGDVIIRSGGVSASPLAGTARLWSGGRLTLV